MKIDLKPITVREFVAGYEDDGEGGVRGYGGKDLSVNGRCPYFRIVIWRSR